MTGHGVNGNQRFLRILNLKGIHARAAAKMVRVAESFEAEVTVSYKGLSVSALSIMGLMLLSVRQGATIQLTAQGPQAYEVLDALEALIAHKFGEEL